MASIGPFNRLVRLAAHAFYDELPLEASAVRQQQGTAVVVLDALARRNGQWVREDDLAASLKLQPNPLRRLLHYLEEDKIVARDVQKEPEKPTTTARSSKEGGEKDKVKMDRLKSYCCLDYAQACDVVRYRIHHMRKKIKNELTADRRATIQQYMCPACGRRYSALDALRLLADDYESFLCEHCSGELVVETDAKIASKEPRNGGDDDNNARRKRRRLEKLEDMQRRMDEQLEPLLVQIQRVEGLAVPEFMSLRSWHKRNNIDAAATVPCRRETEIEVGISSPGAGQSSTSSGSRSKVFPPWMLKPGMDHTRHTGEKAEADEKSEGEDEEKKKHMLEQEYAKASIEALWKQQLGTHLTRDDEDLEEEVKIDWEDG